MLVSEYSSKDFSQVYELAKTFGSLSKNEKDSKNALGKLSKTKTFKLYTAKDGNIVLGFCIVYIRADPFEKSDFASLWYFVVSKSCQNKGIGTFLLKHITKQLAINNVNCIYLTTALDNYACQHCCENNKYQKGLSYKKYI